MRLDEQLRDKTENIINKIREICPHTNKKYFIIFDKMGIPTEFEEEICLRCGKRINHRRKEILIRRYR